MTAKLELNNIMPSVDKLLLRNVHHSKYDAFSLSQVAVNAGVLFSEFGTRAMHIIRQDSFANNPTQGIICNERSGINSGLRNCLLSVAKQARKMNIKFSRWKEQTLRTPFLAPFSPTRENRFIEISQDDNAFARTGKNCIPGTVTNETWAGSKPRCIGSFPLRPRFSNFNHFKVICKRVDLSQNTTTRAIYSQQFYFTRLVKLSILFLTLLCLLQPSTARVRRYNRHFLRPFSKRGISGRANLFDISKLNTMPEYLARPVMRSSQRSQWLYPSVVNLASRAHITSNATCGRNGPEKYCKLVEHVDRFWPTYKAKGCSICNARSGDPSERHGIEHAIDGIGSRWWQSPTIEQGYPYHWVTITLDLRQVFQVAYVIVKAANSPRPANWILEKSTDGVTWSPWQYFAITDSECFNAYGLTPAEEGAPRYTTDSEVMCTSYFSQLIPFENGEIHVSLINGRPSAENPSQELIDFTSARFVRLSLQKIRTLHGDLMTLSSSSAEYADPLVTRRYYYSIKDISIGGMCICYGHASTCPADVRSGLFRCECEHDTGGSNCEICKPGYNQYAWRPGNFGFECQACNCHGHSKECYYDPGVEERGESLDISGDYRGGGVCVGCRDRTQGINCETCIDGYYRPIDVEPDARDPCLSCNCNPYGGARADGETGPLACVKDITFVNVDRNLFPGSCYCKEGYAGQRCDECAFGYRHFPLCEPCPCNVAGSQNVDPCEGDCECKENVEGATCSQCKKGYYNLQQRNSQGCEECFCFGATDNCQPSNLTWSSIQTNRGWEVRDRFGRRKSNAQLDAGLGEPYVDHAQTAHKLATTMYFWSAPADYLGDRLTSYGGNLRYVVSYDLLQGAQVYPMQDTDVILEGNGKTLLYKPRGMLLEPQVELEVSVKLESNHDHADDGWVDSTTRQPINKGDLMTVLRDVKRLMIRAVYSRNNEAIYRIRDVYLDTAGTSGDGLSAESVELCKCPPGYFGYSCESCAEGYWRNGKYCVPCNCNGHSDICNLLNGACQNCQHNTMGMHCERCKPSYYGDATLATPDDCQRCACPLTVSGNNFSPSCQLERPSGDLVCLECPVGFAGKRCEICADGYYGNPAIPGGTCTRCQCNGNAISCDRVTGKCISCRSYTAGDHCERCQAAYYGDPIVRKNCSPCDCNPAGSLSRQCDAETGQCPCGPNVYGKTCDACASNYFFSDETRSCISCNCDSVGSVTQQCRSDGSCTCRQGVTGHLCDSCDSGYFGFSLTGCRECDCPRTNGNCDRVSGQCICPPNTEGPYCERCVDGSYQWHPHDGCKMCECDSLGSTTPSVCHSGTGQCLCKSQFGGRQCNQCKEGHYGFPACQLCNCDPEGTIHSTCSSSFSCNCSNDGQCLCKANVVGRRCDQCVEGSFGLSREQDGCTECYCSGVTDQCTQAAYVWGPPIELADPFEIVVSLNVAPVEVTHEINKRSIAEEVVFTQGMVSADPGLLTPSFRSQPYFWRLPSHFNGDKRLSYGGKLRYTIRYVAGVSSGPGIPSGPNVVIRGGIGDPLTIQYKNDDPVTSQSKPYVVLMKELGWTHSDTHRNVTRKEFTKVLEDIQFFLIKASYGYLMDQSRLSDVLLDVSQPGIHGRGDAGSIYPLARGLEQCFCPPGYLGLSCQDCAEGYMRVQQGVNIGKCEPCNCFNRSDTCDEQSGRCLNCADKFTGYHCEKCIAGYYLSGKTCKKCACPGTEPVNNFSPTCQPDGADGVGDYTCDACRPGYVGNHCEQCADGYYGDPSALGGHCAKCGCNVAGSVDGVCDKSTGQCHCDVGIRGRVCDQCQPRHVITPHGCIECDDGCSGELLHEVEILANRTRRVDLRNMFPPPWNQLITSRVLSKRINLYIQLLLHRKLNHFVVRRLVAKESLVRSSRKIMDAMIALMDAPMQISEVTDRMTPILSAGDACLDRMSKLSSTPTANNLVGRKIQDFRDLLNQVEGMSRGAKRLLSHLSDGKVADEERMHYEALQWIADIRRRTLGSPLLKAQKELDSTEALLQRLTSNFTAHTNRSQKDLIAHQNMLFNQYNTVMNKFDDISYLVGNSTQKVGAANAMNTLNRQLLRQTTSNIDRLNNEAISTRMMLKEARRILSGTRKSFKTGRRQVNNLSGRESLKTKLINLTAELKKKFESTHLNLEPLMNYVKKNVEYHVRNNLEGPADYMNRVFQNISAMSFNQTEAASRWTTIAGAFSKANKNAEKAFDRAVDAVEAATTDLRKKVNKSFRTSEDVQDSLYDMPLTINAQRDLLKNLNNEMRTVNQSTRSLTAQHEGLFADLKNIKRSQQVKPSQVSMATEKSLRLVNVAEDNFDSVSSTFRQLEKTEQDVSRYQFMKKEIRDNLAAIPKAMRDINAASDRASRSLNRIKLLSDSMRDNISNIRHLIADARRKVASIRGVSVKSTGRCAMRYKPVITPGTTTEIVLNVQTTKPNNMLFYLAREKQDYIAVELRNHRVVVTWDLGGGTSFLENPVQVISNQSNNDWFRIEISREKRNMNVTVYRATETSESAMSTVGTSRGLFSSLDISSDDKLFVGGIVNTTDVHESIMHRTFDGCMGEAFLQGKSIGLWHFKEINNAEDCQGCTESLRTEKEIGASNLYSYSGHSYSVLRLPSTYRARNLRIGVNFQTFSSEGLIYYLGAADRNDFVSLELHDGRLVLKLDMGDGVHSVRTAHRYNVGKFMSVTLKRHLRNALLTVKDTEKLSEKLWLNVTGATDQKIDLEPNDVICVGGFPTERVIKANVTKVPFNGCVREFTFGNAELALKGMGVVREVGVSSSCPSQVYRDIGIAEGGHVELHPVNLSTSGSVSMTFNTLQSDALLLLATSNDGEAKTRKQRDAETFYSIYLDGGRMYASVCLSPERMVNLSSRYSNYDNGGAHVVTLKRDGQNVTLQINEDTDVVSAILSSSAEEVVQVRRMYVGGIPNSFEGSKASPVKASLNGCVRDFMMEHLVNFQEAMSATNSHVGTCAFVNITSTQTKQVTATNDSADLLHNPLQETITPETHINEDDGIIIHLDKEPAPLRDDDVFCRRYGPPSLRKSTVHFGANENSHLKFSLKKKIINKFTFEMRVRTFGSSGVLLYASHPNQGEMKDFFALKLKEGRPVFQFDNGRGVAEAYGNFSINDGSWHKIRIKRSKRRGWLTVDKYRRKFRSPKGASQMNVANVLYVGGVPSHLAKGRIGKINNSMDVCVRNLVFNKRGKLNMATATATNQVQECYKKVEKGAYFNGSGYVIYDETFRVGPNIVIEMEFRTTRSNGVILSVANKEKPDGLALELVNGTIFFRTDNGHGSFETNFIERTKSKTFSICDGRWHSLRAEKKKNVLTLMVDGVNATTVESRSPTMSADTNHPLYIGGIPTDAHLQKQLRTTQNFEGCIKNLKLKDNPRVSFEETLKRHAVFPSSCPVLKAAKSSAAA
ncbi:laminin subunit alpha-1-like isoform X3 [Clavelina lepadiformis]|uniref:laminin subunit alpha-1-like isoform X3 n=1 Tax=Clavelina lepadiformis TaxID=159417 RepID=UPI00404269B0